MNDSSTWRCSGCGRRYLSGAICLECAPRGKYSAGVPAPLKPPPPPPRCPSRLGAKFLALLAQIGVPVPFDALVEELAIKSRYASGMSGDVWRERWSRTVELLLKRRFVKFSGRKIRSIEITNGGRLALERWLSRENDRKGKPKA